jgi:magnesium chelatase subunit I
VAEGRYLSDELTIHYGLIPRTNRGIFCINELPDLAERIQVGLLNILEERDVQIRGYRIRLPLDIFLAASANPEDYTNRGRIITPLKDRCGSEIRTHYPRNVLLEMEIMEQERNKFDDETFDTHIPEFMREVVAEITHLARRSPDINQRSGVSVRVSIANFENLISNATKRSIRLNERGVAPRITDLPSIVASTAGKIELESADEGREEHIIDKMAQAAVLNVFNRYFTVQELEPVVARFDKGLSMEASDLTPSEEYVRQASQAPGLVEAARKVAQNDSPAALASGVEFVLEGLHLNRKLNKDKITGKAQYRGYHAFL